jgi:PAS domain S-box-containing protein
LKKGDLGGFLRQLWILRKIRIFENIIIKAELGQRMPSSIKGKENMPTGESKVYRILVADDEEPNLKLFQDIVQLEFDDFTENGKIIDPETKSGSKERPAVKTHKSFDIVLCTQADEAVARFEESIRENRPFAMVFLDVRMPPGPNGVWAAQKIRAMDKQVEIVVVTGYADYHPKEISSKVSPPHKLLYLNKPYRIDEIFQTISCLSSKWDNERELLKIRKDLELRIAERTRELARVNEELRKDIAIRKEVENALRESQESYKILFEGSRDAIFITQGNARLFNVNNAAAEMTGYSRDELKDMPMTKLFAREELEPFKKLFITIMAGEEITSEAVIVQKDGVRVEVEFSNKRIIIGGKPYMHTAARDVTKRNRALRALKESEERYRILTRSMADGVAIIQDGRIIFSNPAYAEMIECPPAEKNQGMEIYEIIDPESHKEVRAFFQELQNGSTEKGSLQFRCKTLAGREFWMEGHFNVIQWQDSKAILATTQDVTEQKNREIAMETATNKYKKQLSRLQSSLKDRYRFRDIIGKSPAIQEVYEMILSAGASDASVVIYGESGTGKELIAKNIHEISDRRAEKFIPVNCGAVPEALFESEFFGHKKGAFTGATVDHPGFFDQAKGGTLFLDEVGELNLNMQVKMLRAIEGGGYIPVGGTILKKADVRIISATNRDLQQSIKTKEMRADFFYRLNVVPINVPPLRDRREDIPLLVEFYLGKFGKDKGKNKLPGKIMDAFIRYDWPGNIRQLQNVLQRYTTLNKFEFSEIFDGYNDENVLPDGASENEITDFKTAVQGLEKRLIISALERTQWHKANAAEFLGLPRRTLFRKIKEYGL